uniref:Link domain-containing protein n=1 Tax=Poecilia latipinna TaxID=48699 RepID=A0A3B3VVZ5_9TELE
PMKVWSLKYFEITLSISTSISTAGVTQVSYQNNQNQLQYAFNASEARKICQSLGLSIASKAQVKEALSRGLETCRYGWTDEQIAVIPRIHALANCGQNKTGLVLWRAPVTNRFDVFCFNESVFPNLIRCPSCSSTDAIIQLKDTVTNNPLSSSEHANSVNSTLSTSSSSTHPPSFTSTDETVSNEVEPARFVGSAQTFAGCKLLSSKENFIPAEGGGRYIKTHNMSFFSFLSFSKSCTHLLHLWPTLYHNVFSCILKIVSDSNDKTFNTLEEEKTALFNYFLFFNLCEKRKALPFAL